MPRAVDIGVTGGAPNLLGSLTAAARPLPENVDWQAFGTSHVPENCGFAFPWQQCTPAVVTPGTPPFNEQQTVDISGATGGDFTLTFDGQTTAAIPYGSTAATVLAALEALSNIEPGDFSVTGGPDTYTITALDGGQYANTDIVQITIDGTGLTGPGEITVDQATIVEGSPAGKPFNDGVAAVEFHPFLVEYNAQSCDGIPADWESLEARARRGLAVRVSNAIDQVLSSSLPDGSSNENPNLPSLATDITAVPGVAGAGVCSIAGLIEDAYACGATGELFIHAPAWLLPALLNAQLITQVGNVYKLGPHTVVLDQGYTNEGPTGSVSAGPGEAWIYVSGPIEYATGPVQILTDTTRGVSPRLNRANAIAAQLAIYRFDPCCVYAALVGVC